jgi:hypothetical protein
LFGGIVKYLVASRIVNTYLDNAMQRFQELDQFFLFEVGRYFLMVCLRFSHKRTQNFG